MLNNKLYLLLFLSQGLFVVFGGPVDLLKNDPSRLDDIACTICLDAANYIQQNPMKSRDDVYLAMVVDCKGYSQYYKTCIGTLNRYLDEIYRESHNPILSANFICYHMNLCPDRDSVSP